MNGNKVKSSIFDASRTLAALMLLFVLSAFVAPSAAMADLMITNSSDPTRVFVIPQASAEDRPTREIAAQAVGCDLTGFGPGSFTGCNIATVEDGTPNPGGQPGSVAPPAEPRTVAVYLFDASMGSSCLTCNFMSFFMVALADFSYMVYQYFYNAFIVMAPIFMAVWLGYRAAKLMVMGGEDGKEFIYQVVGRLALFSMLWIIATAANSNNTYLWNLTGPLYLDFAFRMSNEIRVETINSTTGGSGGGTLATGPSQQMLCESVTPSAFPVPGGNHYTFVGPAMKSACFIERSHVLGIASGAALAFDSYGGASLGWTDVGGWFHWLFTMVYKVLIGLFVAILYAVSAIWLIFLILDVVSRGLITAAFSPVLVLLYTYKPTRQITQRALTAMGGALVTAIALSMVSVMAFVLVTNTVKVYEATKADVAVAYEDWDNNEVPGIGSSGAQAMADIDSNRVQSMRDFIEFIGVSDSDAVRIPMDFGTPWFWYMAFCGIAIFALGKKIIKMLEDAVGYQGASEFANTALKSVKTAAVGAMAGTAAVATVGGAAVLGAGKAGAYMAGGGGNAMKNGLLKAANGMQFAGNMATHKNVLRASGMGIQQAQNARPDE